MNATMNGQAMGKRFGHRTNEPSVDPETLFRALEDETCRRILEATAGEALTASELCERCDVPQSTMYRKLDLLAEAALVEETLRLSRDGRHSKEYQQCFDDVTISLGEDGGVAVDVSASVS